MDNDLFWKRVGVARATQRCWAEYVAERTLRYHYVCGHSVTRTFDLRVARPADGALALEGAGRRAG